MDYVYTKRNQRNKFQIKKVKNSSSSYQVDLTRNKKELLFMQSYKKYTNSKTYLPQNQRYLLFLLLFITNSLFAFLDQVPLLSFTLKEIICFPIDNLFVEKYLFVLNNPSILDLHS